MVNSYVVSNGNETTQLNPLSDVSGSVISTYILGSDLNYILSAPPDVFNVKSRAGVADILISMLLCGEIGTSAGCRQLSYFYSIEHWNFPSSLRYSTHRVKVIDKIHF